MKTINEKNETEWYTNFIPKNITLRDKNRMNVIWFVFDGGSRFVLNKQLPLTVKYIRSLKNEYNIYEMMRYHLIGVNSAPNYSPLIFGIRNSECKKSHKSIFQDFSEEGYITIDSDMTPEHNKKFFCKLSDINSFSHSLNILSYEKSYKKIVYSRKPRCVGKKNIHQYSFEYIKESMEYYNKYNQPVFILHTFMDSHDPSFSSVPRLDRDIVNLFSFLKNKEILKNTIIILNSDHGMHYGRYKNTKFGDIDHKLPLLSFVYYCI